MHLKSIASLIQHVGLYLIIDKVFGNLQDMGGWFTGRESAKSGKDHGDGTLS